MSYRTVETDLMELQLRVLVTKHTVPQTLLPGSSVRMSIDQHMHILPHVCLFV